MGRVRFRSFLLVPPNYLLYIVVAIFISLAVRDAWKQYTEDRKIVSIAHHIVRDVDPADSRSRVLALRDFLRNNVTYIGAPYDNRPLLRATAVETIESGKGYCGEVTRTFVCLAHELGIYAQRINLYGTSLHVVAAVEMPQGEEVIVDCQSPPTIKNLESIEYVMLRPEFDSYSSLNVRRFRIDHLVAQIKFKPGRFTCWMEKPHLLKMLFWGLLATALVIMIGLGKALQRCRRISCPDIAPLITESARRN